MEVYINQPLEKRKMSIVRRELKEACIKTLAQRTGIFKRRNIVEQNKYLFEVKEADSNRVKIIEARKFTIMIRDSREWF